MKPMKAHRIRISDIPATKATVPFHFCLRAKKATVLVVPMMSVRPIRNNICQRGIREGSMVEIRVWESGIDVRFPLLAYAYG